MLEELEDKGWAAPLVGQIMAITQDLFGQVSACVVTAGNDFENFPESMYLNFFFISHEFQIIKS